MLNPRCLLFSAIIGAASFLQPCSAAKPNPKRGLVFVESPDAAVNSIWRQDGSPLTWYYNYMYNESSFFAGQAGFEFVPQYWGAGDANDTSFLDNVTALIKSGVNVTHVLGFNQPDLSWSEGGANISAANAARLWVNNFIPLQKMGIKIGLPVVNAQREPGNWTVPFLQNCTALLRAGSGNESEECPFDFVPIHSFGNMSSLQKRVEMFANVTGKPVWLTEYALADAPSLSDAQAFFNASLEYLDSAAEVERYAYFGAFRADVSNVGPNAAMLDPYNKLTDIGSWYLGGQATGNLPSYDGKTGNGGGSAGDGTTSCSAEHPCGKSGAGRAVGVGGGGVLGAVVGVMMVMMAK